MAKAKAKKSPPAVVSQKSMSPRWLAMQSILLVVQQGRTIDDAFLSILAGRKGIDERDVSMSKSLAFGVCRWYLALQSVLSGYLKKAFKKKDKDLEVILLLGLYQLSIMQVDAHAAVNETVKLTLWQKKTWAKGLVNAVLRGAARDGLDMTYGFAAASYPPWFRHKTEQDWPQQADSIFEAGNQQAPMVLRIDLRQLSASDGIAHLLGLEHEAEAHEVVDSALVLKKPCNVTTLDGFDTGLFSVQDAATQLAAPLLDCESGMHVLDACAAPGGKTCHLLQCYDSLDLISLDHEQKRLDLVEENLQRIGQRTTLLCGDAAKPSEWFDGNLFDRILADVPCSASGVIRRHPDIKLLRRASDIDALVALQRDILSALWTLLKPNGKLLYSTCSIFKDENERQIEWFLQNNTDCTMIGLEPVGWGEPRPWGRQILPGSHGMDGFYYALLQKTESVS